MKVLGIPCCRDPAPSHECFLGRLRSLWVSGQVASAFVRGLDNLKADFFEVDFEGLESVVLEALVAQTGGKIAPRKHCG